MVYPTIYWCSNFGTWNCWNAILGNGLYMLYHTIYEHSNFGTWNCWNANPSNGLFALYSLHWCSNLEYLNYWDVSLLNIPEIVYVLSMVCLKCCGPSWLQKIITLPGPLKGPGKFWNIDPIWGYILLILATNSAF